MSLKIIAHSPTVTVIAVASNTRPKTHHVTLEAMQAPKCSCEGFLKHKQCDRAGHIAAAIDHFHSHLGVGERLEFVCAAISAHGTRPQWNSDLILPALKDERDGLSALLHQFEEEIEAELFAGDEVRLHPRSVEFYARGFAL